MNVKRIVAGTAAIGLLAVGFTGIAVSPASASASPTPAAVSAVHNVQAPTVRYPKYLMPLSDVERLAQFNDQGATLEKTTRPSSGLTSGFFTGSDLFGDELIAVVGYGNYSAAGWKKAISNMKKQYGATTLVTSSDEWVGMFTKDGITGYISLVKTVRGKHITVGMIFQDETASGIDSGSYTASALALGQSNYMYDIGM